MSLGGSSQKSSSQSEAQSNRFGYNQNNTYLAPHQAAQQNQLVGGFNQALGDYGGGYLGQQNQLINALPGLANAAPTAGMTQLNQFAQQGNPYLQQSINQFGQNLSDQFGRNIQQIGGNAQLAGQRGSSRQGIAEGLAFEEMLDTYGQGVTSLQSQAYNQQQQAAGQYASLEQQNMARAAQAAQGGLAGIGQGIQNYFSPFTIGGQVIGAPSILSSGFGLDLAESTATSRSKGKGSGFNIGIGNFDFGTGTP